MTTPVQDLYPSRTNSAEKIVARRDPVLHGKSLACFGEDELLARRFDRDGFIVLDNLFSEQEVQWLQQEAMHLQNDAQMLEREEVIIEPSSRSVRSIFNVQQFSPLFDRLLRDARLVNWARRILDDEVYVHQSRINYKPGFEGKEFYWHSDFETWHVEDGMPRMRAVSLSLALTDNRPSNGSVMLMPGSQRHYVSCAGQTPENHYKQSLRRQEYGVPSNAALTQLVEGSDIVVATGRAGSVLLFDCNTMHGSAGNITPYPRTNLFFVYNALSNRLQVSYSGQAPRPGFIARREDIRAVEHVAYTSDAYRP